MGKEYFSVEGTTSLRDIPSGGIVHVIGVSGVAMAQLAVALSERGYVVSGSDKEFYEPMGSLLASSRVRCCRGYDGAHIPENVSLVVIGNAVSYGNPEVSAIEAHSLPYTLFPKLLYETVIQDKHSIVVSGTHGKTTTSAMLAWVLTQAKREPSYFVGGVVRDLPRALLVGSGSVSVVEGDEYDSAFFAKVPKFSFYQPNTAIITSIEYDHADIYPDLESINTVFEKMVFSQKHDDAVIACVDFPNVASLVNSWRSRCVVPFLTYGSSEHAEYRLLSTEEKGGLVQGICTTPAGTVTLQLQMPGAYNLKNALAVFLAAHRVGLTKEEVLSALASFRGVKRRQEVRAQNKGIILIEDFAHHPTAVRETAAGIRARFPKSRLIAVFEPRSASSRRKVFQADYVVAFASVNGVILCDVAARSIDQGVELLDVTSLSHDISKSGVSSRVYPNPDEIFKAVTDELREGDVIVIMSNGSFGGLIDRLVTYVNAR